MWTIIFVNLFCQISELIESLVYIFQPGQMKCTFTEVLLVFYEELYCKSGYKAHICVFKFAFELYLHNHYIPS